MYVLVLLPVRRCFLVDSRSVMCFGELLFLSRFELDTPSVFDSESLEKIPLAHADADLKVIDVDLRLLNKEKDWLLLKDVAISSSSAHPELCEDDTPEVELGGLSQKMF